MDEELAQKHKRHREVPARRKFFILQDGKELGPLTFAQLQGYFRRKAITREDYFWEEGMEEWETLSLLEDDLAAPQGEMLKSPRKRRKHRHGSSSPGFWEYAVVTLIFLLIVAVVAWLVYSSGALPTR